jgi:hypothetical protein
MCLQPYSNLCFLNVFTALPTRGRSLATAILSRFCTFVRLLLQLLLCRVSAASPLPLSSPVRKWRSRRPASGSNAVRIRRQARAAAGLVHRRWVAKLKLTRRPSRPLPRSRRSSALFASARRLRICVRSLQHIYLFVDKSPCLGFVVFLCMYIIPFRRQASAKQ